MASKNTKCPDLQEDKFRITCSDGRVVKLAMEDVDDIMSTALEGGITYWCYRAEVIGGQYLGEYASDQISRGGSLRLWMRDKIDGKTKYYDLDLEKFLNGLRQYIDSTLDIEKFRLSDLYYKLITTHVGNEGKTQIYDLDTWNVDADAADNIVQYALWNEVVFG